MSVGQPFTGSSGARGRTYARDVREQCANPSPLGGPLGTDYAALHGSHAPAGRRDPGEAIVIKTSEFSTIVVLVAATAAVVAVQQYRERERRIQAPPAIDAPALSPSTDARVDKTAGVDLAITAAPQQPGRPAGGP